jgi:hypothetical protein
MYHPDICKYLQNTLRYFLKTLRLCGYYKYHQFNDKNAHCAQELY